jgi:N-dimethylarginine dimethylaminohydrolase
MFFMVSPEGYDTARPLNSLSSAAPVDKPRARAQHAALCAALHATPQKPPPTSLPDYVYTANAGLFLPRLPINLVLLANMAHPERARETRFAKRDLERKGYKTICFPGPEPWEGQGECLWFRGGELLVLGYGFRSVAATVPRLQGVLNAIYAQFGVRPPLVLGVKLNSPDVYHLDLAVCKLAEDRCLVRRGSLQNAKELEKYLEVVYMATRDPFALNLVVLRDHAVAHKLRFAKDRAFLKRVFGRVVEVDVGEFEKGGGSVQCLALRLFL